MEDFLFSDIERGRIICEITRRAQIRLVGGVHYVPTVNCMVFEKEICAAVLVTYPHAAFAACWYDRGDGNRVWTLHSRKEDGSEGRTFDVGRFARRMLGSGDARHAQFAEAEVDVEQLIAERDALRDELARRSGR